MFVIMKNGKYTKDFTNGEKLTSNYSWAEKFTSKKAATIIAQQYGKNHGKGFKVVEI
jgi:hypothetical protein